MVNVLMAQSKGKVVESLQMQSKILKHDVAYSVYFPAGYDESKGRYPVVYLLHGYSDDETGWVQFGQVAQIADKAIANGDIPPVIIVMPDAKVTFYINNYSQTDCYEDMFFNEFIPYVDKTCRTRAKKEFRAVAGLSMGGYGSLIYALKHPDVFVAAVAMSAAVLTDEDMKTRLSKNDELMSQLFGNLDANGNMPAYWKENSVLGLVDWLPKNQIEQVRLMIDCGDDDFLYKGNSLLHIALRDKNIYHEYRVRNGGHEWSYWRTCLPDALGFISKSFCR